jgi:hypothetical protein
MSLVKGFIHFKNMKIKKIKNDQLCNRSPKNEKMMEESNNTVYRNLIFSY